MALIQVNLFSKSLMRTVPVNVILPVDKLNFRGGQSREEKPYKTLYLLHGVFGSYVDWISGTRIQRYAEEHDLCVVMPSGDNAFYVDQPAANNLYGEFVGSELVALTRKMFPLSRKREDTFIGGLSMGGFGALRNGLKYADTFGCIAALSAACDMEEMILRTGNPGFILRNQSYIEACFGDQRLLSESDKDPRFLARQLAEAGKLMPKIYMACGEQDSLLAANRNMAEYLKTQGASITLITGPGGHEWDFWDAQIKEVIDWLPTEQSTQGINSGNVGV